MPANSRSGWGFITALVGAAKTVGGAWTVQSDVGVATVVQAVGRIRLSKLLFRVDLAPDVAAGTVVAPTQFRVVVLQGTSLPGNVSPWQNSAYGNASAHPEIPAQNSAMEVLFDHWLDVTVDPGLNQPAFFDFADAGPSVGAGMALIVLLLPMKTTMGQVPLPADGTFANVQLTLGVFGLGDTTNPQGGANNYGNRDASLPRYDVAAPDAQ
jgi:hypothetical protein